MLAEIADAEDSRSSTPEVCLWGERSGDRPIGRDRSHGDRGVCPPRRGDGITRPIPEELDDTALERKLFAAAGYNPPRSKPLPDWRHVHAELRRRSVTLGLLWEEYRGHPDGYGYGCTAGSATSTSNGATASRRPCGRPTRPAKSCSWTLPARLLAAAEKVGPSTIALCEAIMRTRPHPEQGFRSCLGILRLEKTYGAARQSRWKCVSP